MTAATPALASRTLLVIGGTGFFGKSILDAFIDGALTPWQIGRVIVLARHASALPMQFPEFATPGIEYIDADIARSDALPAADIVIHAAASTDARDYLTRPVTERQNILAGTLNYCRLAPIFHAHSQIVYASSGAVYGPLEALIPVREDAPMRDIDAMPEGKRPYAAAKRDAEQAIKALGQAGLRVSIARCFAFIGRWLPRDQHFAIGNFIQNGLDGTPIVVKATHPVYRSYMHADDLVTWLLHIAAASAADCPTFNVGSDQSLTMAQIAGHVAQHFKVPLQIAVPTSATIDWYVPSIDKAQQQLGVALRFDLAQAIAATTGQRRA
ncbi:NAD-dependent epimerase/dehydratase family protein [Amantichitinum ursilacus]|uniref:GDP-6-deoxy-D-mannose reductase n=1 Tax=Amantichitinum ursilacus TaxID=857265 RepID=A0A0N0GN53_9NEIS|nr:NAD(P)-dependent oxidoreductase [Amantichitinum ursilacus]KPC52262.1 GDP-6-deoxy-D-mannose reductase [Amantichitinum ursilacus]